MNIAFFDFDGTITKEDSLFTFLQFIFGKSKFYIGILKNLHYFLAYKAGMMSNEAVKEKIMQYFFQGMNVEDFQAKCLEFLPVLETILKQSALERIQWHQKNGDVVVVVSATFACYLRPLCDQLNIMCLATELEEVSGKLSGKFGTPNCYGIEKVKRIQAVFDLQSFEEIFVYGDSGGDTQMLELGTHQFYKIFN